MEMRYYTFRALDARADLNNFHPHECARGGEPLTLLKKCPGLLLDIAMLEGVEGVGNVLESYGADRLAFGTFAPLFYPESSVLKMKESALSDDVAKKIGWTNAQGFFT